MSIKIESLSQTIEAIQCRLETKNGNPFYVVINQNGFSFYDRTSSSGNPEGNPIIRSADDLFEWIGEAGTKKPFAERKAVQPRKRSL